MSITASQYERLGALRKRAEEGDAEAQFELGVFYSEDFKPTQNIPEAIKWITKAAENGHEEAIKILDLV